MFDEPVTGQRFSKKRDVFPDKLQIDKAAVMADIFIDFYRGNII